MHPLFAARSEDTTVLCVDEMRFQLLAHSATCRGFATIVVNSVTSFDYDFPPHISNGSSKPKHWLQASDTCVCTALTDWDGRNIVRGSL